MHVFVCQHSRADGKTSCGACWNADEALAKLKKLARDAGLSQLRFVRAGCLGPCEKGPNLLVYPHKLWFHGVAMEDLPEIVQRLSKLAPP